MKNYALFVLVFISFFPLTSRADQVHMVKVGETLMDLSYKYFGTINCWGVIQKANPKLKRNKWSGKLQAYREIVIPDVTSCKRAKNKIKSGDISVSKVQKLDVSQIDGKAKKRLGEALISYKKGLYPQALKILDPQVFPGGMRALIYYWRGLCYSRMQDFKEAVSNYKAAKAAGVKSEDIDFELGQALYTQLELEEAIKFFKMSYKRGFKKILSLYHIAYSWQLAGDHRKTYSAYKKLEREPGLSIEMKQIAKFEMASVDYEIAPEDEEIKRRLVADDIIPKMEDAMDIAPDAKFTKEIKKKIKALKKKHDLLPKPIILASGRNIGTKPWLASLSQSFVYDTNVIFQADNINQSQTTRESPYSSTSAFGKYTYATPNRRFTVAPELSFAKLHYFERGPNATQVFTNDSETIIANLRTTYEFKVANRATYAILDYEYNSIKRDINSQKTLLQFAKLSTINIGGFHEWGKKYGDSKLRIRLRTFKGYISTIDNETTFVDYTHNINIKPFGFVTGVFEYSKLDSKTDTSDLNTIRAKFTVMRANEFWGINATYGLQLRSIDVVNVAERGTEFEWNPTILLSKQFLSSKKLGLSFTFDYLDYSSDQASNTYHRFAYTLGANYNF